MCNCVCAAASDLLRAICCLVHAEVVGCSCRAVILVAVVQTLLAVAVIIVAVAQTLL